MANIRFTLRDLAGVAALEDRLRRIEEHPNPLWAPERDGLTEAIDKVSRALFGLTEAETAYTKDPQLDASANEAAAKRWEAHFAFLYSDDFPTCELIWNAMGWDITDGSAEQYWLESLHSFSRQIVCAAKGLRGHLPGGPITDDQAQASASSWAVQIEAEARRFKSQSRR